MRTQFAGRSGLNHLEFAAAIRAGKSPELIASLVDGLGLALDHQLNGGKFAGIIPRVVMDTYNVKGEVNGKGFGAPDKIAFDAQPEMVVESDGEVSAYGDYSNSGNADANLNFPQRQSFHYQVFTQWGEKELAYTGLAGVDLASRKNVASALALNKFQNKSYFFGISGLQNYGLLNDPGLLPSIIPSTPWATATAEQCFQNIVELYQQLVRQGNGIVERDMRMTLACSPSREALLTRTNQFGLNVYDLITKNFPGLTIKTAPEYETSAGELMQLILDEYEGQETVTTAFTEKMRAHAVVVGSSNFSQKKSQGTWGTIWFRPVLCASSLG